MWRSLALVLMVACGTPGANGASTTEPIAELPPRPSCSSYTGTGALEALDLATLCELGLELVPVVDRCVDAGSSLELCIEESATQLGLGSQFDYGELLVGYQAGADHLRRSEIWIAELDWCRFDKGEEACEKAIHDELIYLFEPQDGSVGEG